MYDPDSLDKATAKPLTSAFVKPYVEHWDTSVTCEDIFVNEVHYPANVKNQAVPPEQIALSCGLCQFGLDDERGGGDWLQVG